MKPATRPDQSLGRKLLPFVELSTVRKILLVVAGLQLGWYLVDGVILHNNCDWYARTLNTLENALPTLAVVNSE